MDGSSGKCPLGHWAEQMQSPLGFGLGHSKSYESSQSHHAQGHTTTNSHAYQAIFLHSLVSELVQVLGLVVLGLLSAAAYLRSLGPFHIP